ncbi:hypothetical protein D5086_001033 [Populus alba]|uniref:Uncharacterized protein n=1 Tax=Populus alba TaxID=43335 RepID=A0ACC4CXJ9_POPAL
MKDAEKLIRDLDSNGDRYVDFVDLDEFMEAIIECGIKEGELMDAFLIFDIDKNGFISAKELQRGASTLCLVVQYNTEKIEEHYKINQKQKMED